MIPTNTHTTIRLLLLSLAGCLLLAWPATAHASHKGPPPEPLSPHEFCEGSAGSWEGEGDSEEIGECHYPPGSIFHTINLCASDQVFVGLYTEQGAANGGCIATATAFRGAYCGPIDLPPAITPSAATPISFKGSIQTSGATLLVPGIDGSFPVENLSYDWASNTWSGTLNTLNIPPDKYQNVRLRVFDNDDAGKNCNIGGLTVSD